MATQADQLTKVGLEGFEMVEEYYYGRKMRSAGRNSSTQLGQKSPQHQLPFVYHGPQISTVRVPVIASNETMHRYGGGKEEPVITSDEAAQYYGGFVIVEHRRRKPSPGA